MSGQDKRQTHAEAVAAMAQAMRQPAGPGSHTARALAESALRALAGGDPPPFMDARPVVLWTVHCDECGEPVLDPETETPGLFGIEHLANLGDLITTHEADDEDGWHINRWPGRSLVCGQCARHEQCSACGQWMARWEEQAEWEDGPRHADGCPLPAAPLPGEQPLIGDVVVADG